MSLKNAGLLGADVVSGPVEQMLQLLLGADYRPLKSLPLGIRRSGVELLQVGFHQQLPMKMHPSDRQPRRDTETANMHFPGSSRLVHREFWRGQTLPLPPHTPPLVSLSTAEFMPRRGMQDGKTVTSAATPHSPRFRICS